MDEPEEPFETFTWLFRFLALIGHELSGTNQSLRQVLCCLINLPPLTSTSQESSRLLWGPGEAAAAKAQAAGFSGFPLDLGLGLLPLGLGAGELGFGELGFGAAGAASHFGAGAEGFSTSLCWNLHWSPRVHVPSFQKRQVLLIFFGVLGPFGERDLFLWIKGQLLPRLQVPMRKS